jgi:hypothetical protein
VLNMKVITLNEHSSKLKGWSVEMPNAPYSKRYFPHLSPTKTHQLKPISTTPDQIFKSSNPQILKSEILKSQIINRTHPHHPPFTQFPAHHGIPQCINCMVVRIHRHIHRIAGLINFPFIIPQLPDQIQ